MKEYTEEKLKEAGISLWEEKNIFFKKPTPLIRNLEISVRGKSLDKSCIKVTEHVRAQGSNKKISESYIVTFHATSRMVIMESFYGEPHKSIIASSFTPLHETTETEPKAAAIKSKSKLLRI